ncbi:MAG: putative molybdenum carrier protein [Thermoguttaceae bacterium]
MVQKIVSGGQTGVDRGALDAAIGRGIPHGGWCPRGRRAENGPIPPRYQLRETDSSAYRVRTEQNVLDSDGTLILHGGRLAGGTALTRRLALQHKKPCLVVDLLHEPDAASVRQWLVSHQIETLNVAGPRESQCPGIQAKATDFVVSLLG